MEEQTDPKPRGDQDTEDPNGTDPKASPPGEERRATPQGRRGSREVNPNRQGRTASQWHREENGTVDKLKKLEKESRDLGHPRT